jgi:hypothetical protein
VLHTTSLALAILALAPPAPAGLEPFFPGATYRPEVPTVESLLGFPVGSRAALPAEIETCLKAWAEASPRARLAESGRTHEGRPLFLLTITSPENLARLPRIREGWEKVADPRRISASEAEDLATSLPAVAWLAYSIHGDETSGADASLAVAYHLLASEEPEVERLLDQLVVILDPMMNPDGRHRFLSQLGQHSGLTVSRDDQSLDHSGFPPYGRGNHYWFDLNRDWLFASQPETRARLAALKDWYPLLFVDAHEMGSQATYLFYPPREPINPYLPEPVRRWWEVFARDQAAAFDRQGWRYYTGEWAEWWFPGYSDGWSAYRGAVAILYEQAGIGQGEVARPEGVPLSYREAVHHQAVSSLANLRTLARHRREIARDFAGSRRRAVAKDGPFAGRTFAFLPSANASRFRRFADLLGLHGIEVFELEAATTVEGATDVLGEVLPSLALPAGTLLVPNRQPEAHLAAAILELDLRLPGPFLPLERRELLRHGRSLLYDVSAWSLPLLAGLEAYRLPVELPREARPYRAPAPPAQAEAGAWARAVAAVVDGEDDRAPATAVRLLARGLEVRAADRAGEAGGVAFARGSLVVTAADNRRFPGDAFAAAVEVAREAGLLARPLSTGLGAGDLPDLGGRHFPLLEPARVAVLTRGGADSSDSGAVWLLLDRELGLAASLLDETAADGADLRRYNVVVLPNRWGEELPKGLKEALAAWVEAGGTLIAMGSATATLTTTEGPSKVRPLAEALGDLATHRLALLREWMAEGPPVDPEAVWSRSPAAAAPDPWDELPLPGPEDRAEWERRDRWQSLFMPQGAILAARLDGEHWLTFGCREPLPLLVDDLPILMAGTGVEAVARLGWAAPETDEATGFSALGWGVVPTGRTFYLRLSGLLWPEAAQRLANAPYLTREARGAGQILLFAGRPAARAASPAALRLLANAIVFGPGLGARAAILP